MLSLTIQNTCTTITTLLPSSQLQLCDYFNALFDACEMQDTIHVDLTALKCNDDTMNIFIKFLENPIKENVPRLNQHTHQLVDIGYYFGCNLLLNYIDEEIETCISSYQMQYDKEQDFSKDYNNYYLEDFTQDEFLFNIYDYYKCFKLLHKLPSFYIITNMINLTIGKKYTLQELSLNNINIPLDDLNDIISSIIYRINDNLCYDLYTYPTLKYTKIQYPLYKTDVVPNVNYGMDAIDYSKSFEEKLNEYTNDIFIGFKWDNIIMAGGFPFALVNNVNNCFIEGTDIDLFIHHKEEQVRADTFSYVLYYFYQLGGTFLTSKGIISILVPNVKYPIQLILSEHDPKTIIDDFDLNYVKIYYDGDKVMAHIQCIYALTYQTAVHDNIIYSNYLEKRIHKTIQKNLLIQYHEMYENLNTNYVYKEQEKEYIEYEEIDWNNLCFHYLSYHTDDDAYFLMLHIDNVNKLKILPITKPLIIQEVQLTNMWYIQHALNEKLCIPMFQLEYTKIKVFETTSLMFHVSDNTQQLLRAYYEHLKNITKHLGKYREYTDMRYDVIFINEQYMNKKYYDFINTIVHYNPDINSDHLSIIIKPIPIYRKNQGHHFTLKYELVHVKKL